MGECYDMEITSEKVVSIRDLRMSYDKNEVLKGINLDVYKGQIIGYIGPNGAGKSTTIQPLHCCHPGHTENLLKRAALSWRI